MLLIPQWRLTLKAQIDTFEYRCQKSGTSPWQDQWMPGSPKNQAAHYSFPISSLLYQNAWLRAAIMIISLWCFQHANLLLCCAWAFCLWDFTCKPIFLVICVHLQEACIKSRYRWIVHCTSWVFFLIPTEHNKPAWEMYVYNQSARWVQKPDLL